MLPNIRKWEGGEVHMLSSLEKDCHHRVERLQKYVPFLRKMIDHLEGARDKNRETQLTKMRSLLNILTDSHKKLKLPTIQRCEEILQKLYSKVEGAFEWSTGLPSVKEKLSIEVDTDNIEREDAQSSNGTIHSPQTMESPVSVGSSSRDDSCNSLWRRRKTAMEFFEETPRSPSPPPSAELETVKQPLVIPMERNETVATPTISLENPSKSVEDPVRSSENSVSSVESSILSLENQIRIPLEPAINQSIMALLESKVELPPKPVPAPSERREDFVAKWYQGESKSPDPGRQKNNFGVTKSPLPIDPGISHQSSNVPQPTFMQEMPKYSPLQCLNSKTTSDIPNIDELRIPRRGDLEYHGSERMHIPIPEGEKYVKDYDHCKPSNTGWSDNVFEGRRKVLPFQHQPEPSNITVVGKAHFNVLPFQHKPEPSNITVIGKAQVYDYGHGQNSASDSLENTKETSAESECDKTKTSPKNVSPARVSIREKLALEINKVHRVGVSSGGALRSLSKDLGSPPHHKKVENRDAGPSVDPASRKTGVPVKPKDGEQTPEKKTLKDKERKPSGCVNFADDDLSMMNSTALFYLPTDNAGGVSGSNSEEKKVPQSNHDAGKDESTSSSVKVHQKDDSKITSSINSESVARAASPEVSIINDFSFKKKLIESKVSSERKATDSPSIAPTASVNCEDEDQNSKMSICDGDSDSDSRIPFLESSDSVPPPDKPNVPPVNSTCGFSDLRYLPSPSLSPAPHHSSSNVIQPFVNPSNPSLPVSQGNMEEPANARIWPSPNPSGKAAFPQFCRQNVLQPNAMHQNAMQQSAIQQNTVQQNPVQQNINSPNMNSGNQVIHHGITPHNRMIQSNNSPNSHNIHMESPHLVPQSQFMSGVNHPAHGVNVPSINQCNRPQMKHGLLPDPVVQYRHAGAHGWSQGHANPKSGLLPHPVPRQNWRKESYTRPLMSQYMAEPRSSSMGACDARSQSLNTSVRGSWNRRGGYSKVNDPRDPRMRKQDHSRSYYDSSEPPKKSEEKFWKHPSDPRRANPAILENKHPSPPVSQDKTTISSPLNSLYEADQTPKTGKGYGLQKFRIPKLKNREQKDNTFRPHIIPRAPTPPRGMSQRDRAGSSENIRADDRVKESKMNDTDVMREEKTNDTNGMKENKEYEIGKEDSKMESISKEVDIDDKEKEESEDKERKAKEEFTKELFQTLLKYSLESKDGTNILENSKFLDELREKLKLNPRRKSRPIIESDTESSEEEEEASPLVNKTKKRCRVIIESSESESCGDEKEDDAVVVNVEKSPVKTPSPVAKTQSPRKAVRDSDADMPEERPRTRSQKKLFNIDEDEVIDGSSKNEEPVRVADNAHTEVEKSEEGKNIVDSPKIKTPNRRTKRRSSLELLQEDIREMFICEGVMSATGLRMCRLLKEAAAGTGSNEEMSGENNALKDSEDWEKNSMPSCQDSTSPDHSVASLEMTPPKSTRRRGSSRKEDFKVSSLQPRVLLKKSEVVDAGNFPKTAQTAVRGGFARRSIRRTPNLGDRHQNSINRVDETLKEAEGSGNDDEDDNKRELVGGRELRSRAIMYNDNEEGKKSQSTDGSELSQLNDTVSSVENSDNSCDGSSFVAKCGSNEINGMNETGIVGSNEEEAEVLEKQSPVESTPSVKKARKVIIKRSSLKKVNSKAKRSKVNRRWALGVLKRAVKHKRKGIKTVSSQGIISKEATVVENVSVPAPVEDLTDVNYTCVGSESAHCKLCSYVGKQIVNHYVTKHPDSDVIVSRLSLQQAKIAVDWTETNQGALRNAKLAYQSEGPFVCLMCEAWFTDYAEFFDHVTTHTGEYRFSCKLCPYRSFRDNNVRSHAYYVHQKKYGECYRCVEVVSIENMSSKFEEEESGVENSCSVIPGLVAHMCSKCNFVQISGERVKDHIAKRHGEDDDGIKILKIDLSLISPEPPPESLNLNKNEEDNDSANFTSEETNTSSRDEDDTNASFKDCSLKKDENDTCDFTDSAQVKKEQVTLVESSVVTVLDENVFVIENDVLHDSSNKNSDGVWTELLGNPECDSEISVIKLKLNIKIEDVEEDCAKSNDHDISKMTNTNQIEDNKQSSLPVAGNESSRNELDGEMAGVSDFGVIHKDGEKKEEGKPDCANSNTSEVEIIEINDSDSSKSGESSEDESSSENEEEWTAPPSINKESLFSLEIIPEVKVQTRLLNLADKVMKVHERVNELENKAVVLVRGDGDDHTKGLEESADTSMVVEEQSITQNSVSADDDASGEVPRPGKIRVRCLSGDLLSSTKDTNLSDDINNSERDQIIDVIGTPPGFDTGDNPLCQISSVCSLHPNEQVPEEFIKAVSETETPDLTSLAAYTPTFGSPQSLSTPPEDVIYYSPVKGSQGFRPILPKPKNWVAPPFKPPPPRKRGVNGANDIVCESLQTNAAHSDPFSERMSNFQTMPPKSSSIEPDGLSQSLAQPCNQVKMCSIMRASLYAKASKTPAVFNQVMSNQVKLCHLFKCMGRQCSFTSDESVVFLSHYLGHESLAADTPVASNSSSGENCDNQEKRFDWQQCCYCAEMFSSATAYVKHVKVEHGECTYQCPYCFYRAAAVSYVILHQNSTHITEKVSILRCKNPLKKGTDEDYSSSPVKPHLEAYVCYQGNCKRSFYSPVKYLSHLQLEHSAISIFCCHKCSFQCFKADRLVQHYKLHSFFLYQCVYCEQGSDTSEEILQHLASFHPNKKASVCKRNCQETSNGSARTTGRHPYILYEDIELTEMENVELINVGDEVSNRRQSAVTNVVGEKPISSGEVASVSKQMEDFIEMDDDNSDDEDNLVIAEDPEEDMPEKENEDSMIETEAERMVEETREKADKQKYDGVEETSQEEEQNQEKNLAKESKLDKEKELAREKELAKGNELGKEKELIQEKMIEKENPETAVSSVLDNGGGSQFVESENENPRSMEVPRDEEVRIGMAQDLLLSSPTSRGKANRRNSSSKRPNVEELILHSPRSSKASRNRDELNVCTTDDENIDVGDGNGGHEKRLLRRRDVRRSSGRTTRSQVEPKPKGMPEESIMPSTPVKEAPSPKDPSNGKVDLSELYRCCFSGCSYLAKDCVSLKYHMKSCPKSTGRKEFVCPHCNRKFKQLIPVLKHLRVHGKKNYICMICDYHGHNMSLAVRHVKFRHRTSTATVSPLTDWEEPEEIQSSVKDQKLVVVAPKEVSPSFLLKRRFVPDDADFLPLPCVYNHEAKCGRCSYSTKVRVNMRRHLHLHLKFCQNVVDSNQVTWSVKDAVNPMPCLEGKEMMFDKMTNWALSSHLDAMVKEEEAKGETRRNSVLSEYEEDNFIPRYIPENERYVCGVIGCHYHTVDDTMLRHHLRALHREEATFRCPHCPEEQNALLQVPVDRLASHLKMHDDQLYQCIHCNYFHFQRRFVERHAIDKHCDLSYMVNVIREPDTCSKGLSGPGSSGMAGAGSDGSNRSARSSTATTESVKHENDNMWNCGLCSFSCSNRESISDHARSIHSVFSQYVCGMCPFRTAYLSSFNAHFSTKHLGYPVQLVANYFPSNIDLLALPTVTISLPNGKIIFPPNPTLKKNIDIRIEPVIEVWPYVEQGFGKSSSSSVRLKELNSTYPWQRCMPRVRYIRGIPLAEEGEETMYDLAESLRIKDVIQNDDAAEGEDDDSPTSNGERDELEVIPAEESGEEFDQEDVPRTHEHLLGEGVKKGAKRRMSDPCKEESGPLERRNRTESGGSLTPVKASPSKRSMDEKVVFSPARAKIPKLEEPQVSPKEKIEEVVPPATRDVDQEREKWQQESGKGSQESENFQDSEKLSELEPSAAKVESLIIKFGGFGTPEGNLFVCPVCSKYKTKYKGDMKDHFYRELNYKRYVCTHCGFLAPIKNRLQKHYFRVHKKEGKREAIAELPPDANIELWVSLALNHQCEMMKTTASNPVSGSVNSEGNMGAGGSSSQSQHGEGVVNKTPYSCKYCTSKFATIRGVKIHFKVHHLKIGSWICGYCDVSANSAAIVVKHSKSSHPDQPELIINNTIGSYIDAKALEDSIFFTNIGLPTASGNGGAALGASKNSEGHLHHCSNCNYQTKEVEDLKEHQKSHAYGCGHCSYTSAQESDVIGHYSRKHSTLSPNIINRFADKEDQSKKKPAIQRMSTDDNDITVIDLCSDPEDDKETEDNIPAEQEIIVTLENIGEYGKSNPSFVFKCYYCCMKSFLCDDVVNHWENVHLPTDIHSTHPFKCKRIFAMNHFTFPHQLFQCHFCNLKGSILELKGHFKFAHRDVNFKIVNLQNTKYCCLLCDFSSYSFNVLENHFRSQHSSKDLEYQMKLTFVDGTVPEKCSAKEGVVLGTMVGKSFRQSSKRDTSEEEQFLKDAIFGCCVCNATYSGFNILEKHHAQNHDFSTLRFTIEVKTGKSSENRLCENIIKTYSCSSCPFSTQSFSEMFEHIRIHALPYQCGHCDFKAEIPSKVCQHHLEIHPTVSPPQIVLNSGADKEMAYLYKEMKVSCEVAEMRGNPSKRRAPSPLVCEPKKYCPVARKSTTQVFPSRGFQKPTARKSTNPSAGLIRTLKLAVEPATHDGGFSSSEELDSDSVMSDVGGETLAQPAPVKEFSYYTGGKGLPSQLSKMSHIMVLMSFGGFGTKRVPVSKMAELVDLEPNLYVRKFMNEKCGS